MSEVRRKFGPEWLGYELRRVGRVGLVTPAVIAVGFVLFAVPTAFWGRAGARWAGCSRRSRKSTCRWQRGSWPLP